MNKINDKRQSFKLSDLGEISTGTTPSKKNPSFYSDCGYPFIKPDVFIENKITELCDANEYISEDGVSSARCAMYNDILVTCIGNIGKIGIVNMDTVCFNQQINSISPNEKVSTKYLAYNLLFNKNRMQDIANAPIVPIFNKTNFSNFEITIHPSIDEQKKIVDKLDCIQKVITLQNKQLEKLDLLIKARFVEMFNSEAYLVHKLKDVSKNIIAGGDKPKDISLVATEEYKYPVFANGIEDDGLQGFSKHYRISESALTVSARGSIGYCCVRDGNFTPVVRLVTVVPKESINLVYLKYYFSNLNFGATGTSQKQLTVPLVKDIAVLVPTIDEQNQFADFVTKVEKVKADVQKSLDKTQMLFDSLMQQYFE